MLSKAEIDSILLRFGFEAGSRMFKAAKIASEVRHSRLEMLQTVEIEVTEFR